MYYSHTVAHKENIGVEIVVCPVMFAINALKRSKTSTLMVSLRNYVMQSLQFLLSCSILNPVNRIRFPVNGIRRVIINFRKTVPVLSNCGNVRAVCILSAIGKY